MARKLAESHLILPKEPSATMIAAGSDKWEACYRGNRNGTLDLSAEETAAEIYRAMIAVYSPGQE